MIQGPPIGANRQLRSAKRRVAVDRLYLSCPASRPGRKHMGIYKRIVLTGLAGVAIGLSTVALAQMSGSKSQGLGKLGEDEAMRVGPAGTIQKSNLKVPSARHEAAVAKGAKEISPTSVIYKHGGKMYMFDYAAAANTQAAENFESQFDNEKRNSASAAPPALSFNAVVLLLLMGAVYSLPAQGLRAECQTASCQ